jgi:2-polyprenyl-3-methyl-5-hydroxy-6-metoxy-1,4-benzoquinol methylase
MTLIQTVREQYEELPYPPRDSRRELQETHHPTPAELTLVANFLWGGRRRLDSGFRALDAGCGTGDNAVFMATQLAEVGGQVVGIDLSETSLEITRERAAARGLTNLTLLQGRIEDLPSLGLDPFDYVVSAGVLHHMPSPAAGLAAIREVLKPGGGAGIMVYGQYGRTAIYQLQSLFKIIAPPTLPTAERIRIVRNTLSGLHATHWAQLGKDSWSGEISAQGDAGLFDLLLHPQDRAYTVPEIYDWLASVDMRLARWLLPHQYQPEYYAPRVDMSGLSQPDREAAAELFNCRLMKHTFFVTRAAEETPPPPPLDDLTAIPTFLIDGVAAIVHQQLETRRELAFEFDTLQFRFLLDPFRRAFLNLVDGERSLGTILTEIAPRFATHSQAELIAKWSDLQSGLDMFNVLGLYAAAD